MCVIHTEHDIPVEIGDNVTIGHNAVIHCKKIGSNCIIGMGAMLLVNAEIGECSIIAAGAVVTENQIIPPRSLVMGVPGKIVRKIGDENIKRIEKAAQDYLRLSKSHYEGQHKKIH
jgi:carbonic anhydrase/acetyltransferase-like protein (isoleucine patch superfamily)